MEISSKYTFLIKVIGFISHLMTSIFLSYLLSITLSFPYGFFFYLLVTFMVFTFLTKNYYLYLSSKIILDEKSQVVFYSDYFSKLGNKVNFEKVINISKVGKDLYVISIINEKNIESKVYFYSISNSFISYNIDKGSFSEKSKYLYDVVSKFNRW